MGTVISTTGAEPVALEEAKLAARVDNDLGDASSLDGLIAGLITSAREQAEHLTGRTYREQVIRFELCDWPTVGNVLAVNAASSGEVTYWDGSDWVDLDDADVVVAPSEGGNGTVVVPALGATWPDLVQVAAGPRVRIDLTAGPADPEGVPESVKLYIKAQVGAWLKTPEAIAGGTLTRHPLFDRLLDRERIWF